MTVHSSYDANSDYALGDIVPSTDASVLFYQAISELYGGTHSLSNTSQWKAFSSGDIPNVGSNSPEDIPESAPSESAPSDLPSDTSSNQAPIISLSESSSIDSNTIRIPEGSFYMGEMEFRMTSHLYT